MLTMSLNMCVCVGCSQTQLAKLMIGFWSIYVLWRVTAWDFTIRSDTKFIHRGGSYIVTYIPPQIMFLLTQSTAINREWRVRLWTLNAINIASFITADKTNISRLLLRQLYIYIYIYRHIVDISFSLVTSKLTSLALNRSSKTQVSK